jgi:hypothetical protein
VTAGGGMSLGLGHLGDVDQLRNMITAGDIRRGRISLQQGGKVPAADLVQVVAALALRVRTGLTLERFARLHRLQSSVARLPS